MGDYTLLVAVAPIVVGIVGVLGNRWVAGLQARTKANEDKLRDAEVWSVAYNNLRSDYDRVVSESAACRQELRRLRQERDDALAAVAARDRKIEKWIEET